MSRVTRFRGSILGFVAAFLFLATFVSALCTTPRFAHAIRSEQQVDTSGTGSGFAGLGQGDDDQPTINPPPSRRTTVQMSEPTSHSSGPGASAQATNQSVVRKFFVSGRDLLRRVFNLVRE